MRMIIGLEVSEMTINRLYRCNLCQDYIKPSDSTSKIGFGVHFDGEGYAELKNAYECVNHICCQCANSVYKEMCKITLMRCPE